MRTSSSLIHLHPLFSEPYVQRVFYIDFDEIFVRIINPIRTWVSSIGRDCFLLCCSSEKCRCVSRFQAIFISVPSATGIVSSPSQIILAFCLHLKVNFFAHYEQVILFVVTFDYCSRVSLKQDFWNLTSFKTLLECFYHCWKKFLSSITLGGAVTVSGIGVFLRHLCSFHQRSGVRSQPSFSHNIVYFSSLLQELGFVVCSLHPAGHLAWIDSAGV